MIQAAKAFRNGCHNCNFCGLARQGNSPLSRRDGAAPSSSSRAKSPSAPAESNDGAGRIGLAAGSGSGCCCKESTAGLAREEVYSSRLETQSRAERLGMQKANNPKEILRQSGSPAHIAATAHAAGKDAAGSHDHQVRWAIGRAGIQASGMCNGGVQMLAPCPQAQNFWMTDRGTLHGRSRGTSQGKRGIHMWCRRRRPRLRLRRLYRRRVMLPHEHGQKLQVSASGTCAGKFRL